MATSYLVLAAPAEGTLEVSRSRFLARVEPVATEAEARAAVEAARRDHWDARHHCSAFRLGPPPAIQRSSDDGEPSGTAGAPILEALTAAGLSDVVAVVTRWFGGTLLGTGGLVRAYGDTVRAALGPATLARREERVAVTVAVAPAIAGRLENALRRDGERVRGSAYTAQVAELTVLVARDRLGALTDRVDELSAGTGEVTPGPVTWVDVPVGRGVAG